MYKNRYHKCELIFQYEINEGTVNDDNPPSCPRTSKSTGKGGGGRVDLSTLRLVALSLPFFDFAFFPILTRIDRTPGKVSTNFAQDYQIVDVFKCRI
jgi:hypothetical protein